MFQKIFIITRLVQQVVFLFLVAMYLNGCSTLNKNECLNAEWESIGYQDGVKGYLQSRIGRHRKACSEYGIKPDLSKYISGYDDGVREYCKPQRGYSRGLKGYENKGACKGSTRKIYNNAYMQGRQIYNLELQVKENKKSIKYILERNHRLEEKRVLAERKLINKKLTREQRANLVYVLRGIGNKMAYNTSAIQYHEKLINEIIREVNYLRSHSEYR